MVYIIPTSLAEHLGRKINSLIREKKFDAKVIFPGKNKENKRHFPDGEVYIRLPPKFLLEFGKRRQSEDGRVVVLHSGAPKPNDGLAELEIILQALKEVKIKPVEIFFSYFPYGMQDAVFKKGETNVAENLIKKFKNYYGVRKIYIIEPHFLKRAWPKNYPLIIISAFGLLKKEVKKDFGDDVLFLGPDAGSQKRFKIPGFSKVRENSFMVTMKATKKLEKLIKKRTVVIADDVIKTGGTLVRVYEKCQKRGAKKIIIAAVHGGLEAGILRIKRKCPRIYLTNTVKNKEANVDVTDLILSNILKN